MRGKHKGQSRLPYYDKRRKQDGDEWSREGPHYKQNGKKKFPQRFDGRDYDYKYIHKDKKVYSKNEIYDIFAQSCIVQEDLEYLVENFGALMIMDSHTEFIGDDVEIQESWFVEQNEKENKQAPYKKPGNEHYNGLYDN